MDSLPWLSNNFGHSKITKTERNKSPAFLVSVLSFILLFIKIQTNTNSLHMFYQYKNALHLFQWLHYSYWRVLGLKILPGAVHSHAAQGWTFGFDKHKSHILGCWATTAVAVSARSFQPSWTANSLHFQDQICDSWTRRLSLFWEMSE